MMQAELDRVVQETASLTHRNVSLDDVTGKVLAHTTVTPNVDRARINAVLTKEVPAEIRSWEAVHGVNSRTRPFLVPGSPDDGLLPRMCIPLLVRGVRVAYLWVQANSQSDSLEELLEAAQQRQDALDYVAGRVLVALGSGTGYVSETGRNLRDLVSGQSHDISEELRVYTAQNPDARLTVFAAGSPVDHHEMLPSLAYSQALQDVARQFGHALIGFADDQHGVFLAPSLADIPEIVTQLALALRIRTTTVRDDTLPYGVSDPLFNHNSNYGTAYRQSITALQAASVDPSLNGRTYEDAGIFQLFAQSAPTRLSSRIILLQGLPDGEEKLSLLERVYDSPGPMQRTANSLHMHRTSVYNHLQRIESVIGADPLDPIVRLDLHASLKLRRWLRRPRFSLPTGSQANPQLL